MEKDSFYYKRKPAFISFLPIYFLCFVISFLLLEYSPVISKEVTRQIIKIDILRSGIVRTLPFGIIFSFPFIIYGIRTLLWNLMTTYEIDLSEIRLLSGSLSRKEHLYLIPSYNEISYKQNIIEAPFRVGSLLFYKGHAPLVIKGVHDVKFVVECLRKKINIPYH
jgi:energy-converting hydrogenase Eha subunit A